MKKAKLPRPAERATIHLRRIPDPSRPGAERTVYDFRPLGEGGASLRVRFPAGSTWTGRFVGPGAEGPRVALAVRLPDGAVLSARAAALRAKGAAGGDGAGPTIDDDGAGEGDADGPPPADEVMTDDGFEF